MANRGKCPEPIPEPYSSQIRELENLTKMANQGQEQVSKMEVHIVQATQNLKGILQLCQQLCNVEEVSNDESVDLSDCPLRMDCQDFVNRIRKPTSTLKKLVDRYH